MQIRRILEPCAACGETMIFGDFAPAGDVLKLNEGWSRVRCPSCRELGPVRASFRETCESWNALALRHQKSASGAMPAPMPGPMPGLAA